MDRMLVVIFDSGGKAYEGRKEGASSIGKRGKYCNLRLRGDWQKCRWQRGRESS